MESQLFLEIGTEELPARFIQPAMDGLARLLTERLAELHLAHGEVHAVGTPRRVTVWIDDVSDRQEDREEVKVGPPARIAYDKEGNPSRAAQGFARTNGVEVGDLFETETPRGPYLAARIQHKGRATAELLAEELPAVIDAIPFKKSMRWGHETVAFGRPVRWICALYAGEAVTFEYGDVTSGTITYGHRVMAPAAIEVTDAQHYQAALYEAHVIVDPADRRAIIREELAGLAQQAGGRVVEDEELIHEVANLTEDPWGGLGSIDPENLKLPREVLISSMRKHQRYFALEDEGGALLPHFAVFNNTRVRDPAVVIYGNERVLKARLHDGTFFYAEDRKRPLGDRLDDLKRVTFLGELGKKGLGPTSYDRTQRLIALAERVAAIAYPEQSDVASQARRAAELSKTDLTTLMVGEFPDLQGTIGAYYARADGEPDAVATAIGEQYMPRGVDDDTASTPAGVCLALADKLEKIAVCFAVKLIPTGNKDPYGLRRAALGVLKTLEARDLDLNLRELVDASVATALTDALYAEGGAEDVAAIMGFFEARLRSELVGDHRSDIVDAVMAAGFDRPRHARLRVAALSDIAREADLAPIGEAFKRINNILQRNADQIPADAEFNAAHAQQEQERALGELAADIRGSMREHLGRGDYRDALSHLTRLQEPLEDFFNEVMVMADDETLRTNRLALLEGLRSMFEAVADVSRIHVGT
ncbi:MAG: glycine--tRNA ligase subunit beta [Myxococcales bacterium]|nr:glycine--tRNA ligase subunit beta [Myxococcales bacterium]